MKWYLVIYCELIKKENYILFEFVKFNDNLI